MKFAKARAVVEEFKPYPGSDYTQIYLKVDGLVITKRSQVDVVKLTEMAEIINGVLHGLSKRRVRVKKSP